MKWAARDLQSKLGNLSQIPAFVLIYGDDSGAIRQAKHALLAATHVDLADPFVADTFDVADLATEPGKLRDAAGTLSLLGGLRVVQVTGFTAETGAAVLSALTAAVQDVLQQNLAGTLIVISAPGLAATSALAKAVTAAPNAAAVRCFQDNSRDVVSLTREMVTQAGKTIGQDALLLLCEHLGADRDITRMEVEKLILFAGDQREITATAVLACLASAPAANVFKLCDAIGLQDTAAVERYLDQLLAEEQDANMLFHLVVRHLLRLRTVQVAKARGLDDLAACREVSPPVTFGQREFLAQVNAYPKRRLEQVLPRALSLQAQSRQGDVAPEIPLRRGILALGV